MKADHGVVNQMLMTARGQLDGVLKMVEEDRYCVDISTQLLAIEALLKKTNKIVLHAHLKSCVSDSFITGVDVNEKIDEVLKLLDKFV